MRFVLGFICLLTGMTFSQIEIDSSSASYEGNSIILLKGSATFQANPNFEDGDYSAGFLFGIGRVPVAFVPAGSFVWINNRKRLDWQTEIVNLPYDRYFYQAFISPRTDPVGFSYTSDTPIGDLGDDYNAPFIAIDLPRNVNAPDSSEVTLFIFVEGTDLTYEWQVDIPTRDSLYIPIFDSLNNQIDSTLQVEYNYDGIFEIIQGEIDSSYTFVALEILNRNRYRVRVFNNLGEVLSRVSTLRVRNINPLRIIGEKR